MGDEEETEHKRKTGCAVLQQNCWSLHFVLARELNQEKRIMKVILRGDRLMFET
jgi:hypothetical protein